MAVFIPVSATPPEFQPIQAEQAVRAVAIGSARFVTTWRTRLQILYPHSSEWLDSQNRAAAPRI